MEDKLKELFDIHRERGWSYSTLIRRIVEALVNLGHMDDLLKELRRL